MNVSARFVVIAISLFVFNFSALAQYRGGSNTWKRHRTELYGALSATSFLGELGGRNEIGSDFIYDFELNQTRWGLTLGGRHYLSKSIAIRSDFMLGYLAGNDNLTSEPFRQKRNLHFRSFVMELSGMIEYNYRRNGVASKKGFGGSSRNRSRYKETIYSVFVGVGGLKFNPRARYNEQWFDLQPLGTEGQNIGATNNKYSLYALVIPVGVSVRKSISKRINLSFEINHRITFTDYIDDVSTVYYDPVAIESHSGEVAAYLADPSFDELVLESGESVFAITTSPGLQRGDSSDNDSYLLFSFGANYKLNTYNHLRKRSGYKGRKKGRKRVF